ncbi:MAG TPA: hypothetical protein ENG87_03840 [Candidatus Pacearchaeota archaeon]|nr:hypothetical protein [Candidatus Pacearchaeota archaeon]
MFKPNNEMEEEIINSAVAQKECIPEAVRIYLMHFLRNTLMRLRNFEHLKLENPKEFVSNSVDRIIDILRTIDL